MKIILSTSTVIEITPHELVELKQIGLPHAMDAELNGLPIDLRTHSKLKSVRSAGEEYALNMLPLQQRATAMIRRVMAHQEEIIEAFIAKHGCNPEEAVLCVQRVPDGERIFVRKQTAAEIAKGHCGPENL